MSETMKNSNTFIGYEYKEVVADERLESMYIDCYQCFGWFLDENTPKKVYTERYRGRSSSKVTIRLKRDRKIINKMELTRLQRHFESCLNEMEEMKQSVKSRATGVSIVVGIIGTVCMAGSTFAVTASTPMIALCIILAIPGFMGWIAPVFLYKKLLNDRAKKLEPLIEEKQDEIYEICEKGNKLLNK